MDGWPNYWPGLPPMWYATHCVSPCLALLSKPGKPAHAESVVCHGSGRQRDELISKYGISEPVAVDNEHKLKDAFQNEQGFVPAYYLFDSEGKLRSFAAGERGLDMLKTAIERIT